LGPKMILSVGAEKDLISWGRGWSDQLGPRMIWSAGAEDDHISERQRMISLSVGADRGEKGEGGNDWLIRFPDWIFSNQQQRMTPYLFENNIFKTFWRQTAKITNSAVLLTQIERIFIDNLSLKFWRIIAQKSQLDLELSWGSARDSYC